MNKIKDFYDNFSRYQSKVGVNLRHRMIFRKLKKYGLKRSDHVLEIGCGVGQLTSLIAKYIDSGFITAFDISDENILIATNNVKKDNVSFKVSDITDFGKWFDGYSCDIIVLADVLEHLPPESYDQLIKIFTHDLAPNGFVFINIPHPEYLKQLINTKSPHLQIIDHPVNVFNFFKKLEAKQFTIENLDSYSIWSTGKDYLCMVIKRNSCYREYKNLPKWKLILKRLYYKL